MKEIKLQKRPYGIVEVEVICKCDGCRKLGGWTVAYQGITSIANPDDLMEKECPSEPEQP